MSSIHYKSALELVHLIKTKALSPFELITETLKRIDAVNPAINAFVAVRDEAALDEAREMTKRMASGEALGPLAGIPIGVKDLEDVEGMVTSFGSVPFKDNVAGRDSIQVARLKGAGAIVVGKTNTPEFGYTAFTKNRLFGVTTNPWNRERTPGGSSGGSAAAVAAGMVPMATGSDAGGSIRIPASYSGCFGLKTSFGRIPLGPCPFQHIYHFMTLGPLTRTVRDAALYLDCVKGYHPCDPASLPSPSLSYVGCLEEMPQGLRVAFSPNLGFARVQKDVMSQVEKAVACLEEMGHQVVLWDGVFPDVSETWAKLMDCELYGKLHQSLDRDRDRLGRTLVQSLDQVKAFSLKDLVEAQKLRTGLNRILWEIFETHDLLVTPTMPSEAFGAKGPPPSEIDGHSIPLLWAVAFTYPFNLSGHPAASVPAGLTESGLPVGLQMIGPHHREDRVLQAAYAYEQARPWENGWPDPTG
jgi:aspartyl-tRNA(Asn)/glutamyl-tRNA(Gln) amidotransferase subunit A